MTGNTQTTTACAIDTRVLRNTPLCKAHVALELLADEFPESRPGQFLQVRCGEGAATPTATCEWRDGTLPGLSDNTKCGGEVLLRRPLSIADRWTGDDSRVHLVVILRTVGPGTHWLATRCAGDVVNVSGPFGNGFAVTNIERPIALVGGGVGIPPLLYLARTLCEAGRRDVTAVFGATTGALMPVRVIDNPTDPTTPTSCVRFPNGGRYGTILTTDDGSLGLCGRVTDGLSCWREQLAGTARRPIVYACGPEAMLRGVARMTRAFDMDCQLCIERMMGCGMGTCLSCVVRAHDAGAPQGWRWALSCTEGPVFDRDVLVDMES